MLLARKDSGDYEADWAAVVYHEGEVLVIYNDGATTTRWMRRSLDGGDTWQNPSKLFALAGESGAARFGIDGDGQLHMFFANRTDGSDPSTGLVQGLWRATWLGEHWTAPEPIVFGPQTPQFDPTRPEVVISGGNLVLATWTKDTTAGPRNGAWYSSRKLDATELEMMPLPTPIATSTLSPQLTSIPLRQDATVVPIMESHIHEMELSSGTLGQGSNAAEPIGIVVAVVGLFLLAVFGLHRLARQPKLAPIDRKYRKWRTPKQRV